MSPHPQPVARHDRSTPSAGSGVERAPDGTITVSGEVVGGDRRGRELGFPTANVWMPADDGVEDGVWAARVTLDGVPRLAAASLGHRPTFYDDSSARLLEVHILDFQGDLYGRRIVVGLHRHLRPQRRFRSMVALIRQMKKDVEEVRRWGQAATPRRSGRGAPRAPGAPSARRVPRERLIAAAVQEAAESGAVTHARVADLCGIPVGYVRWAHPGVDDLLRIAGTVRVEHPF